MYLAHKGGPMTAEIKYEDKPWLTSYEKSVPEKITYQNICLPDILKRTAAKFPHKTALVFEGYKLTYQGLNDMVNRFAAALKSFGIQKGDSVAILLPNLIPCVAAYYAILQIGGIAVMNNPLYSNRELEHQFNDIPPSAIICPSQKICCFPWQAKGKTLPRT